MLDNFFRHQLVEQILFKLRKSLIERSLRLYAIKHRDPEDPPALDA
jgi:hypothetical protein